MYSVDAKLSVSSVRHREVMRPGACQDIQDVCAKSICRLRASLTTPDTKVRSGEAHPAKQTSQSRLTPAPSRCSARKLVTIGHKAEYNRDWALRRA